MRALGCESVKRDLCKRLRKQEDFLLRQDGVRYLSERGYGVLRELAGVPVDTDLFKDPDEEPSAKRQRLAHDVYCSVCGETATSLFCNACPMAFHVDCLLQDDGENCKEWKENCAIRAARSEVPTEPLRWIGAAESTSRGRLWYRAVERFGIEIRLGNFVAVKVLHEPRLHVARVVELWAEDSAGWARVHWFRFPDEIKCLRVKCGPHEIFRTKNADEIPIESIAYRVRILHSDQRHLISPKTLRTTYFCDKTYIDDQTGWRSVMRARRDGTGFGRFAVFIPDGPIKSRW